MNKNLKRVISAASALAVSASGVAAFAASYPDVPATADYAQAVTELSALNIINGFDDGTFKPDENVTRAQITKMVVTALGNTAVSQADASAGRDTQFADVPGTHWASGFVAVGTSSTASNFINGYSATAFGPEDNVTYAQAIKMLVAALGYTTLAEGQGGWPSGYLKYGYSLGLTEGLSGIGNDDQLNRAQVSVLIDNALKCPICVSNGYTYNALGQQVPNTLIKDGTGDLDDTKDGYQNLLNYAHDAYLVYGRVMYTFKSGGSGLDADEVRYNVEKSDNWDGYSLNAAKNDSADLIATYKGQVEDADDYLFTYSQAIIQKDRNDEYTLISLVPYGASETIVLEASDYKKLTKTNNSSKDWQLQMYKDAGHSKYDTYKIVDGAGLYINGREATSVDGIEELFNGEYVKGNKVGQVTLIDSTDEGKSSTDGKYDYVMVTYYVDGIVDEVEERTDEVNIILDTADQAIKGGKIVLDYDDDDKDYNIFFNGEKIDATDIQTDDVVSVAYDVNGDFRDSDTYDIFVSRDTVDGKVQSVYEDPDDVLDNEYTLDNGEVYKLAYEDAATLESGTSYTLYLDAFGKVAKVEELASSKKYALLENVYWTNGDADAYVDVVTGTGSKVSYQIKTEDYDKFLAILMGSTTAEKDITNRANPVARVIAYKLTGKGELRLDGTGAAAYKEIEDDEFKSATNKLGKVQLSESLSQIVDISDYDKNKSQSYSAISLGDFVSGTKYGGAAYGATGSDNIYQFVLITEGIGGFNVENDWAVYVQATSVDTDNGDRDAVTAYVGGELRTIAVDTTSLIDGLAAGDVFFYKLNSDSEIDEVKVVTKAAVFNTNYQDFSATAVRNTFKGITTDAIDAEFKAFSMPSKVKAADCAIIAGPIVDVSNGNVSIASNDQFNDTQTISNFEIDECDDYELASDVNVYVYDYSVNRAKDRVSTGIKGSVRKSGFENGAYIGKKSENVVSFTEEIAIESAEENNNYGNINYAVAKVVDDEITEILVIVPDSSTK